MEEIQAAAEEEEEEEEVDVHGCTMGKQSG